LGCSFRPSYLNADDRWPNSSLAQHPLNFLEEIADQRRRVLERVRPTSVTLGPVPMVAHTRRPLQARTLGRNAVSIVEADQPRAVRRVQRERVGEAMWSLFGCCDPLDVELE
jgi:hypothetical protein